MGVSKVKYGENTLVDLTQDTVTPEVLRKGYTAHGADGEPIIGTEEPVLMWTNTENGAYKFEQNGDRWIANNRGINSSTATSTWTVTVPSDTKAYIGWRTATENADKLTVALNGIAVGSIMQQSGIKSSETVVEINISAGQNTLVAIYTKDGSVSSYGDMAYVILPPIGQQPGRYRYQSKSVSQSGNSQTVYPDTGYDGLYAVTVAASTDKVNSGTINAGASGNITYIDVGFVPKVFFMANDIMTVQYDESIENGKEITWRYINKNTYRNENVISETSNGWIKAMGSTVKFESKLNSVNKDFLWYAIG